MEGMQPSRRIPRTQSCRRIPRTQSCRRIHQDAVMPTHTKDAVMPTHTPGRSHADAYTRTHPIDHTSLPMYVRGTFNSEFQKLRYGVKSHFFGSRHSSDDRTHCQRLTHSSDDQGTLQMTGHTAIRLRHSSHYLAL
jgi:hypothetical protein